MSTKKQNPEKNGETAKAKEAVNQIMTTTLKENLTAALGTVTKFVGKGEPLQILNHVLLSTDGSRLKLQSTNLAMFCTTHIGARHEGEFSIAVPAKLLSDVVNLIPGDAVTIEYDAKLVSIQISGGGFRSEIKGVDAQEFPVFRQLTEGITLNPTELYRAIATTAFAASTEDQRPVLTGINITTDGSTLVFAATDGFRLAKSVIPTKVDQSLNIIVPAEALQRLAEIIKKPDEGDTVTMSFIGTDAIGFRFNDFEIVALLIEGAYPEFEKIIPKSPSTTVKAKIGDLLQACRAADVFARENAHTIRLSCHAAKPNGSKVTPGGIEITSQSAETGSHNSFTNADVQGDDVEIAFNVKYLAQHLRAIESLTVGTAEIQFSGTTSPAKFLPLDVPNNLHVIMPMRLGK